MSSLEQHITILLVFLQECPVFGISLIFVKDWDIVNIVILQCHWFQDGDIVNIDVTVYHRGYHGDLNETFFVGNPKDSAKKLVKNTWDSLEQVKVRKQ